MAATARSWWSRSTEPEAGTRKGRFPRGSRPFFLPPSRASARQAHQHFLAQDLLLERLAWQHLALPHLNSNAAQTAVFALRCWHTWGTPPDFVRAAIGSLPRSQTSPRRCACLRTEGSKLSYRSDPIQFMVSLQHILQPKHACQGFRVCHFAAQTILLQRFRRLQKHV